MQGRWKCPRDPRVLSLASPPDSLHLVAGNVVYLYTTVGTLRMRESDVLLNGLSHQSHLILQAEAWPPFCKKTCTGRCGGALAQRELLASSVAPLLRDSVSGLAQGSQLGYAFRWEGGLGSCVNAGQESAPGVLSPVHQGRFAQYSHCNQRGLLERR